MPAGGSMLLKAILEFDVGRAMANMGKASVGFRRMQSSANRVTGGMGKMGGAFGRAALGLAPLAVGFGLAVHHARQFGRGVSEVATIADEAEFPISKIEATTLDLAKTFGTAPVEQTKGLYQAISAGATSAAEATGLLDAANKLAIGGVSDTFTSIDVLTTALNAYKQQELEATDATDTLFTAVRLGKTTVDELGAGLGQVIPTAAQLGIKFSDLNAAVAAITTQGIVTAQATTGLNAALANIIKPSDQAKEAAAGLGIEFTSTALKSKGLVQFMGEIVDRAGGDEVALSKLFGSIRGVRAIMALTNAEGQKFNEIVAAMEDRAGAADKAFQKMAGTAGFQMRKLNALRVVASTVLGQVMTGSLVRMAAPLADVLEGFVGILEAVKSGDMKGLGPTSAAIASGMRDAFDAINAGVDSLVSSFRSAGGWLTKVLGPDAWQKIAKFGTVLGIAAAAIAPIGLALAGVGFIVPAVVTAVTGLATVISGAFGLILGPIGIAIAAVIVFREQLWSAFQGLLEVVGPVFEDIKAIFWDLVDTVMRAFGVITGQFDQGTGAAKADWREVGRVVGAVLGAILTSVAKVAAFVVKLGVWGTVAFKSVGEAIGELGGIIVSMALSPLRTLARGLVAFMEFSGMEVPFSIRAYAGGGAAPRAAGRGVGGGQARGLGERVAQFGKAEARASAEEKVAAEEHRGALASVLDEVKNAANSAADGAHSAADAAKKKPCASVNLDGREVARSNRKAEDEIKERSGFTATPWQRRMAVEHGAVPVTRS